MMALAELNTYLDRWLRRYRLQRAVTWSARGLIAGLAIALALLGAAVFRGSLPREEFVSLLVLIVVSSIALASVGAYLWPVSRLKTAQFFDRRFGLRERVSTALELASAVPSAYPPGLVLRQLEDTLAASRAIRPRAYLPLRWRRAEVAVAAVLVCGMLFVWFAGGTFFRAAAQARAVRLAIDAEFAQIEAIRQQIEGDESLTPEQRRTFSAPLDEARQALQDAPSLEQATSALTRAQQELQALSDPQAQQQSQSLRDAGDSLSRSENASLQQAGQDLAEGDFQNAAQDLQDADLSELTQEEAQAVAEQLEEAADTLESTLPKLAQQLREAAEAARSGDAQAARQALQQAAETLSQVGEQIAASETAQQAAAQIGESRQRVVQAGQDDQVQNLSAQAGAADQSGQGQGQGQSQSAQPGQGAVSAGSGRGQGDAEGGLISEVGADPISQDNAPGDAGQRDYEPIYAPERLGGSGGEEVALPNLGDPLGEVIGQGDAAPGETGFSTVPYAEVFAAYEQAYRRAIDSGQVPVQLRALIRAYFTSLQP